MKISDIRKMNNAIIRNSEDFVFFKKLYEHCVSVIDAVPESFVKEVLEEANQLRVPLQSVCVSQEAEVIEVSFWGVSRVTEEEFVKIYSTDNSTLDFQNILVFFNFDDEGTIRFYDNMSECGEYDSSFTEKSQTGFETRFNPENIERIFGKSLIKHECNSFYVVAKCFE